MMPDDQRIESAWHTTPISDVLGYRANACKVCNVLVQSMRVDHGGAYLMQLVKQAQRHIDRHASV